MLGRIDLGDLPNGSGGNYPAYPTNLGFGAAHILFPNVDNNGKPEGKYGRTATWLGDIVDAEPAGQASPNAKGDDNNGSDEDSVNLSGTWVIGSIDVAVDVIVSSSQPATVPIGVWLDWDFDGEFDAFYTVDQVISGSSANVSIPVTIPAGFTPGSPVVVRVRAFDPAYSPTSADYAGTFDNGEVEDHYIIVGPTPVSMSQLHAGDDFFHSWSVTLIGFLMLALTIIVIRMRKRRLCLHN